MKCKINIFVNVLFFYPLKTISDVYNGYRNESLTWSRLSLLRSLLGKYPYLELFWSAYSCKQTKYGPKKPWYGHFSRSGYFFCGLKRLLLLRMSSTTDLKEHYKRKLQEKIRQGVCINCGNSLQGMLTLGSLARGLGETFWTSKQLSESPNFRESISTGTLKFRPFFPWCWYLNLFWHFYMACFLCVPWPTLEAFFT